METINGWMQDECLHEHVFSTLAEARRIIEAWRIDDNEVRPHSSLGDLTPDAFAAAWRAMHVAQTTPDVAPAQASGRAVAVGGAMVPEACPQQGAVPIKTRAFIDFATARLRRTLGSV